MRKKNSDFQAGFWPGVSDSMLGALMMVMLLAIGGLLIFTFRPQAPSADDRIAQLVREIEALKSRLAELENENRGLKDRLSGAELELQAAEALLRKKAPPIIEMADVASMSFDPGSAELSEVFERTLSSKYFPQFLHILEEYEVVDTIEIIGHTDRTPVSSEKKARHRSQYGVESTLDRDLSAVIEGQMDANAICQGSNADLGLMRGLKIQNAWKKWLTELNVPERIKQINIRTYSAAFAVLPGTPPADDATEDGRKQIEQFDKASRRIEVRFTRLRQQ